MKSLVLLCRCNDGVLVKEFPNVKDNKDYYLFEQKDIFGDSTGIMKKYVGKICKCRYGNDITCDGKYVSAYPVEIPYIRSLSDTLKGYFVFVNKNKYDENPLYYHDMIKNYREE